MPLHLLDTNILLRLSDTADASHALVISAVEMLENAGDQPVITSQVLVEFWAVSTRPVANNGLGWTTARTEAIERGLIAKFPLLEESGQILTTWLDLVATKSVQGKQAHDARLAAVVLSHGLSHVLTFNVSDFSRYSGVTAVHPRDVVSNGPT